MNNKNIYLFILGILVISFSSCKDDDEAPCEKTTWYQDSDSDGFGNSDVSQEACEKPEGYVSVSGDLDDMNENLNEGTIWSGPKMTFTKEPSADPTVESNQDRITDDIWITRGIQGGGIYNAKTETEYNDESSPAGTQWSLGTTADLSSLTFKEWDSAVGDGPPTVIGKDMVLYIVADKTYVDINIISWEKGGGSGNPSTGGFSYSRSTKEL